MSVKNRSRYKNGFTLVETLVSLGLIGIVVAFAAYAGYRFFRKNAETAYQISQWERVQAAKTQIGNLINSAVYISSGENCGSTCPWGYTMYGIESSPASLIWSTEPLQSMDLLQMVVLPQGGKNPVYTVTAISDCGADCSEVTLLQKGNESPSSAYLQTGDHLFIASSSTTEVVQVNAVSSTQRFQVRPRLRSSVAPGRSPVSVRVEFYTLWPREVAGSIQLVLSRMQVGDLVSQIGGSGAGSIAGGVLIDGVSNFNVSYQLAQKQTRNRTDNCNPDPLTFYRWPDSFPTGGSNPCNPNSLVKVKMDFEFAVTEDGVAKKAETSEFAPNSFDPKNWGNFASLNLSGPEVACDDKFEFQRCQPACQGRYRDLGHRFNLNNALDPNGPMMSEDFEPGTDYCTCLMTGGIGGDDWPRSFKKGTYDACCSYRNKLMTRMGTANRCVFPACTQAVRADNPDLVTCHPDRLCGKTFSSRACYLGNETRCDPDATNSQITTFDILLSPNGPGQMPNFSSDNNGWVAGSNPARIVRWNDSNACGCFRQLFPRDGSGNVQQRVFTVDSTVASYAARWPTAPAVSQNFGGLTRTGQPFNPDVLPNDNQSNPVLLFGFDHFPIYNGNGWVTCFDPIWDDMSAGNNCAFQATNAGGVNTITRAPFDSGSMWWSSNLMPGERNGNDQYFMVRCACERAGLPHDPVASRNAVFNGFVAGNSPSFSWVPSGRCSCFNPFRASISNVNPGLSETQIRNDCFPPPTPTGGGTGAPANP